MLYSQQSWFLADAEGNEDRQFIHFASASFATEISQVLAYSSAEWSLGRPPSRLNSAHESTMLLVHSLALWIWKDLL